MYQNMAQAILLLGQGMSGIFAVLGLIAIIVFAMQQFSGKDR